MSDPDVIRWAVANLAATYDGVGAAHERERYLDLLAGGVETPAMRGSMAQMSSCALTVRGLWRALGCSSPILARPYRIGRAIADVIEIATVAGAWRTGSDGDTPGVGDAVIVGVNPRLHAYTVIAGSTLDGVTWAIESIDGGQGLGGTTIKRKRRTYSHDAAGALWDVLDDGTRRRVYGWADCVALGLPCGG